MCVYIPLARKYRPQKFADVVGQDVTIKIITRGMQKNRLGAAMLFSGTRGIGKTTIARILAKAFRCENFDGTNVEPCCKCESCLSFARDNQIDVIEIDAASNTSVDDVREIIESCRYKPTTGKFKIFIIDEVHMLSKSAFNALLKTLEEPPEHVKFLMATTETYKIPETILSRVLKFDLKPVDAGLIAQYLSSVCNQENISAGAEALSLIAKAANGSIRDSLSILDQAINMADNNTITVDDVKAMLCLSDDIDIIKLLDLILDNDVKAAVTKYREILKDDISAVSIANLLLDYVHAMTCLKTDVTLFENTYSQAVLSQLKSLAEKTSLPALSKIWQMLIKGLNEINACDRPEIVMEMIIVRIAYASGLPDLYELINREPTQKKAPSSIEKPREIPNINSNASEKTSLANEAMKMFSNAKLQ